MGGVLLGTFLASGGGALLGGLVGAFAGFMGAMMASRNARRDQVWKRVEWALSMVLTDDPRAEQLGAVALVQIIEDDLADKRDLKIITALATAAFENLEVDEDVHSAEFVVDLDPGSDTPGSESAALGEPQPR
jgi:hypothetical protein